MTKLLNSNTIANRALAGSLALLLAGPGAHALTDLGPGGLFLDVSTGVTYDSNVFTNAREDGDFIYSLSPTLSYVQDRGLVRLTATAATSFYEYEDLNAQSGEDYLLGFDLSGMHREPSPSAAFTLSGNYANQSVASEEVATRIDIEAYGLNGTVDFDVSDKTGLRFGAGWSERDYKDNAYSDSEDYNVRGDFLYRYSEKLSLKTGYRYREISYDDGRDLESDTFTVGAEGEFTDKLSGSLELGGTSGDRLDGTQFYYAIGLNWAKDQNTSYSLSGKRDNIPSAVGARATRTQIDVSVAQRFTDRLSGNAFIGAGRFEREDVVARDDDIISLGAGLNLAVGNNASVFGSASFETRDSDSADSDYDRILLSAGASVRF